MCLCVCVGMSGERRDDDGIGLRPSTLRSDLCRDDEFTVIGLQNKVGAFSKVRANFNFEIAFS